MSEHVSVPLQARLDAESAGKLEVQATLVVAKASAQRRETLAEALWTAAAR